MRASIGATPSSLASSSSAVLESPSPLLSLVVVAVGVAVLEESEVEFVETNAHLLLRAGEVTTGR